MKSYQEITLIEQPEIPLNAIWEKLFIQMHLALVESKDPEGNAVAALSFPDYRQLSKDNAFPLGAKLRVFAKNSDDLQSLNLDKHLNRLKDYCHWTSIKDVPSVEKYAVFNRLNLHSNVERLARRRAKRKGGSIEEALKHFEGFKEQRSDLPFINLRSLSKGESFKIFIERELKDTPMEGVFSCYGLSKTATVPWF
jgi:CRISPR-associated endonuclease Csy4